MELHVGIQKDSRRHKNATIPDLGIKIVMLKWMPTQHNEMTSQFNNGDHTVTDTH